MIVRLTENYVVMEKGEVTVAVTVGQGQKGNTEMFLEGKRLGGRKTPCTLGSGKDLTGKKLRIVSVVTDTSNKTNLTSVTYELKGGKDERTHTLSYTVKHELETVDYVANFKFI